MIMIYCSETKESTCVCGVYKEVSAQKNGVFKK